MTMTDEQVIKTLEKNAQANQDKPYFVEACNRAIEAIKDGRALRNRCRALSGMALCKWCNIKCEHRAVRDNG